MASTAIAERSGRKAPSQGNGSSKRRQQILATAAELFAEHGFESTSVRQIADAVEILAGSLYHHFATKDAMLHEIVRAPFEQIVVKYRAIADLPLDPEARLVTLVHFRFAEMIENWHLHAIILQEANLFRRRPDFDYVQDLKTASFEILQQIFEDGIANGMFRPDLDLYLMIGAISRLLSSAASWFRSGAAIHASRTRAYAMAEVISFNVDCILRMVRVPSRIEAAIPMVTLQTRPSGQVSAA
jgi:TetR/AcrR family transcriptional regulator, cholesterol catabolism regulator